MDRKPTVLLVDDDPGVPAALARLLRREPWRILVAHSGEEALDILGREEVDVIVTDEQMPGMRGSELLAAVRRRRPEVVGMILSGQATLEAAIRAINEGRIWRFFVKPANPVDLRFSIRQALELRELLAENRRLAAELEERDRVLRELEERHPGITELREDEEGAILLDPADA